MINQRWFHMKCVHNTQMAKIALPRGVHHARLHVRTLVTPHFACERMLSLKLQVTWRFWHGVTHLSCVLMSKTFKTGQEMQRACHIVKKSISSEVDAKENSQTTTSGCNVRMNVEPEMIFPCRPEQEAGLHKITREALSLTLFTGVSPSNPVRI